MNTSFLTEPTFIAIILLLSIFDAVLKGIALWKSGRRNQLGWFICLIILNTCGILPIIYLILNKDKQSEEL